MWLLEIFRAIAAMFSFSQKAIPPDEIRISEHEIRKPRKTADEKIKIYNIAFRKLKNYTELDIATYVGFVNDEMDEEDKNELIELLTARISAYRFSHPLRFKKWIRENR